jgi:hypothetical protein
MPTYEFVVGGGLTPRVGLALLAVLIAGCRAPPVDHLEQSRSYAKAREVLWDEILHFLASHRIVPVRADPADGRLEAERHAFENISWAHCEPTTDPGEAGRP